VPFKTFDVWDQSQLTTEIRRPPEGRAPGAAEDAAFLGETIAPFTPTYERVVRVNVSEILPFGIAKFRAPDASVPIVKHDVAWREVLMELVLIDEQERIGEEEWRKLNSPNENERRSAGVQLVDKGRILRLKNERAAEWMRWKAFQDELVIPYNDGASEVAVGMSMKASHRPTVAVSWSDTTNSDPVADIQAWAELLAADTGFYGRHVHMNSNTYNNLIYNAKIRNAINFYASGANSILRPRKEDILSLFETFSQTLDIVVYDNGYRDVGEPNIGTTSLTKYLPDNYVLVTTEYTLDGVRIADTLEGVVTISTAWNETALRQGVQAEMLVDHESKNHLMRVASARMPRLLIPDAFVWAKVVF